MAQPSAPQEAKQQASEVFDVWKQAARLYAQAWKDQAQVLRGYGEVVRGVAKREKPIGQVGKSYVQAVRQQATTYQRLAGQLGLTYLNALVELGRSVSQTVLAETVGEPPAPDGPVQLATLSLRGPLGSVATGTLTLTNSQPVSGAYTFQVGSFSDSSGMRLFRAPVTFEPSEAPVAPSSDVVVAVSLTLTDTLFEAGQSYRATAMANGPSPTKVALDVGVEPSA